ncbi:hypothetical protein GJAV_G00111650 [Gymnothorax javanicus]|nr:hypothetical protein GJAV_G00111650 [Gymnothorax javanicus]
MGGSSALRLLFAVTLCLSLTSADSGIEDLNPLVSLPTWKPSAEYITKCDFNSDRNPFCGWTHLGWIATPQGSEGYYLLRENSLSNPFGVTRLESDRLTFSGAACLEFWYRVSGSNGTDLRVLIRDDVSETEIWTSQTTADGSWQQVFIPLQKINRIQVVFEADVGFAEEGIVTIDNVGVRIGPCGEQCTFGEFWADDACTTKCACSAPGPQLTCSPASCPEGQTCKRSSGASVCLPNSSGTCSLHSAPHITTFDGASHRFAGSCNYVLAKVCSDSASVPFFQVEVRNEQRGDSHTSSVQQVNVALQGLTVSLLRSEASRVLVNGIWKSLPLSLNNGAVMVSSAGVAVILETDFALMVSYDATSGVQVKVPALYGNQVCGLCGNFNHQSEDDHGKPDGSLAVDAAELAQSWQSAGDSCNAIMLPDYCPLAEEAKYESEANCGVILSKESPFAGCSSVITAEVFFRSCVFEMCAAGGDPQALCDVLQTFATACQSARVTLPPWRNATDCPLVCQANSHYNECASGCPATCSDKDTAMSCGACEERCDCDPGFLLSGGKCVPEEDCGCWINEQHVEKGESVMQGDCKMQCQCMGHGKVQCSSVSCGEDEVCRAQDGVFGCFTPRVATCHVYGDPHYLTYDGKLYNFQGACNYTLAKACGHNPVQFTVTGRNENRGNLAWSALNSVALEMKGLHLALRKGKDVYVNGALTQLPAAPMTGVKVALSGAYVQVDTDFGLQLLFDGDHRLFVRIDERHWAQMCGLCGTYSGSQFDDFLTPDGVVVSNPDEFANSWRVKDSEWPCSDSIPAPAPCEPWLENDGYQQCSILFGDIFKVCHEFVPVQLYVNSCTYDHCATRGNARQLCTSLESYVAACELAGVNLGDWRDKTICANFKPSPTDISTTTHSHGACPLDCNFDDSECGWTQTITDSFDWTRRQGSTPTELTGPSHDHTTGSGSYMYIEADGVYRGDSARMISPQCQVSGPHCLQFWYHMYGSATAMALNIYLLEGGKPTKIWAKANNQGNAWIRAQVDFKVGGPFQIIIEGLRGSDQRSDVAFDDLSILAGECSGPPNAGLVSTVAPSTYSTPPSKVCSLDCNFESDLCTWEQLLTDSFDWTRQSGPTLTSMTGPSFDHTTGAGHYLYIEGDGVYNGDTARLLSSECSASGPHCLQFWYHIYGTADTMGLTAYLLEGRLAQRVWSRRNNRGDVWHLAKVDINPSGPFQIIFEGRRGTTTLSDVALDDVSLQRGTCSDLIMASTIQPPAQTPAATQAPVPPATTTQRPVQTTTTTQAPMPTTTATQAPVSTMTTTQRPVQTTTTTQAPVPTTTATQAPVSTTTTTQRPVQTTTTTQTPVQTTTTTQRPVQPNTTHKPVPPTIPTHKPERPHTTHHPAPTTTTTQRPVQPNITHQPVQPTATTQRPVQTTTTTQAPVPTTTTTRAPVSTTTTTQQPVQTTTTTQRPVQPNTSTQGPVQTTRTTQAPVQTTTTTQRPVQPNTTHKPVPPTIPTHKPEQPHTTHHPVETTMTTQQPVQPTETTKQPVPTTRTTQHPLPTTKTTQGPVQTTTTTQRPAQTTTTTKPPATSPVPSCKANSHYTDCAPRCEPTCMDLKGVTCILHRPCQPGCVCNDGFVRKLGKCVPIQVCGCRDDDGQNRNFGEIWTGSHCAERCKCQREQGMGEIVCEDYECGPHEVCHLNDEGDFKCKYSGFSECSIAGDPEYRTFDDRKHDFEGKNSYILVRTVDLPQNLPDVHIVGINKKGYDDDDDDKDSRMARDDSDEESDEDSDEDDYTGRLRQLKIRVYNHTIEFKADRVVVLDGEKVSAPFTPFLGIKILERSSRIYLKTDFGLSVEFDGDSRAEIILPNTYKKKVGGLCGNFDGKKRNDFMKPDGSQAKDVKDFGDSWRVTSNARTMI